MELDIYGLPTGLAFSADWFLRRSRAHWVRHILPRAPFHRYVEVGTYEGMSLAWTIANLLAPDGSALAIDSYMPIRETPKWQTHAAKVRLTASENLEKLRSMFPSCDIELRCDDSRLVLADNLSSGNTFGLVYVDGGHQAEVTLLDMCLSWAMLEIGGIMVVDDAHLVAERRRRHDPKTREAIEAFKSTRLGAEVMYDVGDQCAFSKRRARLPRHPTDPKSKSNA